MRIALFAGCVLWIGTGCSASSTTAKPGIRVTRDAGGIELVSDVDGDGINDSDEGQGAALDTDRDGTPDYRDTDSDADGIFDSVERGGSAGRLPVDTDSDGAPDFQDTDSDDNGLLDEIEGDIDSDGDGLHDAADRDNDGDALLDADEIGTGITPEDFDSDGLPDYMDLDSDNDGIGDRSEGIGDIDSDGVPNRHDLDSDGDALLDALEAGDTDVLTPPIDTDHDLIPDFLDVDSDSDGLADRDEGPAGADPRRADSDGDGVTDLIEVAACPEGDSSCLADVTNAFSSPRTRGDFVFLEPYEAAPSPVRDTLSFSTDIQQADVYFLVDTTGSMSGAISSLVSGLSTPGTGLIDRVRDAIPSVWFGVGDYKDYGVSPYGGATDYAYRDTQPMTDSASVAQAAVNTLTASGGSDVPESTVPALWATATGLALGGESGLDVDASCPGGTLGYPCFREGSVPIVVLITDAAFHNGPGGTNAYSDSTTRAHAPTYNEAVHALDAANVRVIGISVGSTSTTTLDTLASDTGAVDDSGLPLVTTWRTGESISDSVVDQIETMASQTPIDISVEFEDDASDSVASFAAFVDHLEANTVGDAARGCAARRAEDRNGDGHPDTFAGVTPGTRVCFDVVVKQNATVAPTAMPQLFKATVRVLGDGFTELDAREVYFLVPPVITQPVGPD